MKKVRIGAFPRKDKKPIIERVFRLVERYSSRNAAARAWGINVNTLKNYYRREEIQPVPRQKQLLKIANVEGVSMEWLMTGQGDGPRVEYKSSRSPGHDRLADILSFLNKKERQDLADVLARKGVELILYLLDEDNIELLKLDRNAKAKILEKSPCRPHPEQDKE